MAKRTQEIESLTTEQQLASEEKKLLRKQNAMARLQLAIENIEEKIASLKEELKKEQAVVAVDILTRYSQALRAQDQPLYKALGEVLQPIEYNQQLRTYLLEQNPAQDLLGVFNDSLLQIWLRSNGKYKNISIIPICEEDGLLITMHIEPQTPEWEYLRSIYKADGRHDSSFSGRFQDTELTVLLTIEDGNLYIDPYYFYRKSGHFIAYTPVDITDDIERIAEENTLQRLDGLKILDQGHCEANRWIHDQFDYQFHE